eukprot:m.229677 g.229677  ORF g.229677 m.229677 type:complete len:674 (+) comp17801_c0_seq1:438-2459(+)
MPAAAQHRVPARNAQVLAQCHHRGWPGKQRDHQTLDASNTRGGLHQIAAAQAVHGQPRAIGQRDETVSTKAAAVSVVVHVHGMVGGCVSSTAASRRGCCGHGTGESLWWRQGHKDLLGLLLVGGKARATVVLLRGILEVHAHLQLVSPQRCRQVVLAPLLPPVAARDRLAQLTAIRAVAGQIINERIKLLTGSRGPDGSELLDERSEAGRGVLESDAARGNVCHRLLEHLDGKQPRVGKGQGGAGRGHRGGRDDGNGLRHALGAIRAHDRQLSSGIGGEQDTQRAGRHKLQWAQRKGAARATRSEGVCLGSIEDRQGTVGDLDAEGDVVVGGGEQIGKEVDKDRAHHRGIRNVSIETTAVHCKTIQQAILQPVAVPKGVQRVVVGLALGQHLISLERAPRRINRGLTVAQQQHGDVLVVVLEAGKGQPQPVPHVGAARCAHAGDGCLGEPLPGRGHGCAREHHRCRVAKRDDAESVDVAEHVHKCAHAVGDQVQSSELGGLFLVARIALHLGNLVHRLGDIQNTHHMPRQGVARGHRAARECHTNGEQAYMLTKHFACCQRQLQWQIFGPHQRHRRRCGCGSWIHSRSTSGGRAAGPARTVLVDGGADGKVGDQVGSSHGVARHGRAPVPSKPHLDRLSFIRVPIEAGHGVCHNLACDGAHNRLGKLFFSTHC